jgi:hypothetical protein
MRFVAEGEKIFFDIDLTSINGSNDLSAIVAYDGEHFQEFVKNRQRLEISKVNRSTSGILAYNNLLFLPYFFLFPSVKADSAHIIRLKDWTNPVAWREMAQSIENCKETTLDGRQCVEFVVPGGKAPLSELNTSFRVTLAKDLDYFPVKWERINERGETLLSYHVTEIGREKANLPGGYIYYPRKASSVAYEEANPKRILTTMEGIIDHVGVNTSLDPDIFTLDPAAARVVYDVDTNTVIRIPR